MFQIKELLAKFKLLEDPAQIRNTVALTINECIGVNALNLKSLEIRKNIVWLKVHPAVKQRISQKTTICIEAINSKLPELKIIDIK